jgi:hypothetical protein
MTKASAKGAPRERRDEIMLFPVQSKCGPAASRPARTHCTGTLRRPQPRNPLENPQRPISPTCLKEQSQTPD